MLWLLAILACNGTPDFEPGYPDIIPGSPIVGAAEGRLNLPVGSPLSGYSVRCTCLSGQSRQDLRDSAYTVAFVESTGVQTQPMIKVIWMDTGDDHLVIIKTDNIYSFDRLVEELGEVLSQETGDDLRGRVIHTTSHSHHSYGAFSDQPSFYLGSDRFNEEVFQSFLSQTVDVAMEAFESRVPAKVGIGWEKDWDPEDKIYRDRRGVNNDLVIWEDGPEVNGKDPYLAVFRADTLDDKPIALMSVFGMHGITLDADNPMLSVDSPGHVEIAVQEAFDEPVVVMFVQGSGGDASPAGGDNGYARMESVGDRAVEPIFDLWSKTPTSSAPLRLESVSRHIPEDHQDILVTRNGTVNWSYRPYEEGYWPDDIIYVTDEEGEPVSPVELMSPIDEFNTPYGSAFCGTGDLDLPVGGINTGAFPYSYCLDISLIAKLMKVFFKLDEDLVLPMNESIKAGTSTTRLGPIATLLPDGRSLSQDLLIGFFPGEPTSMFAEQWRRRVEAELGYEQALLVGYAQDHEGYLLLPEDWLLGEYEADISLWGPLQSEHIMESMLFAADEILATDVREDSDPTGRYAPTQYPYHDLPTLQPDTTPNAGTRLLEAPDYYWLPLEFEPELTTPASVERITGMVQLGWIGGDPGVDNPTVELERLEGEDWVTVTSRSGREISDVFQDILIGHTPDPLYPAEITQTHYWWAGWQAVGHIHDRPGVPVGTYRLHVTGERYLGGDAHWPWQTESYSVASDAFDVEETTIELEWTDTGLELWYEAPSNGYRRISSKGDYRGSNPVEGPVAISIAHEGTWTDFALEATTSDNQRSIVALMLPQSATQILVHDQYGNLGTLYF